MRKLVMTSIAGATIAAAVLAPGAFAGPGTTVIYDSTPHPAPGNISSVGFEATGTSEFGDQVSFAGTARTLDSVTVDMSIWACQAGHWNTGNCVSDPAARANVPITFKLYNVDLDGTSVVDPAFATVTQTFSLPYRPSADPSCTGAAAGKWRASDGCYNGMAYPITFNLAGTVVPDNVIYSLSFATATNGSPLSMSPDNCLADGGCFVNSLNVGLGTASVGSREGDGNYDYRNTTRGYHDHYCDNGAGGTGSFRYDSVGTSTDGTCQGETPSEWFGGLGIAAQFNAVTPGPTCPSDSTTKSGNIGGNLTVPSGQNYCLDNAHVAGDITVQKGASLTMINGSSSGHDVKGKDVKSVIIDHSTVLHDVVVSGATGPVSVTNSTIGHDLNLTGNKGSVTADSNVIGHDMNVKSNTGTSSATNNTVSHYQNCTGNSAFTGSDNSGTGAAAASCNTP